MELEWASSAAAAAAPARIAGRLRGHAAAWRSLGASPEVLGVVTNGCEIPFDCDERSIPRRLDTRNGQGCRKYDRSFAPSSPSTACRGRPSPRSFIGLALVKMRFAPSFPGTACRGRPSVEKLHRPRLGQAALLRLLSPGISCHGRPSVEKLHRPRLGQAALCAFFPHGSSCRGRHSVEKLHRPRLGQADLRRLPSAYRALHDPGYTSRGSH